MCYDRIIEQIAKLISEGERLDGEIISADLRAAAARIRELECRYADIADELAEQDKRIAELEGALPGILAEVENIRRNISEITSAVNVIKSLAALAGKEQR